MSALKGLVSPAIKATLMLAVATTAFTSCSDDDKDVFAIANLKNAGLTYGTDGAWDGAYTQGSFSVDGFTFTHQGYESSWGNYYYGFVPSNSTAAHSEDLLTNQFDAITAGGYDGDAFFVGFWNTQETTETALADRSLMITYSENGAERTFTPHYAKITNTCYSYYTMLNGSAYSKVFGQGDYFKVIAHGVKESGAETTAEFYLADCSGADSTDWFVNTWADWDLTGLGEVKAVYFTMESSDTGSWGMNNPAYIALDYFCVSL